MTLTAAASSVSEEVWNATLSANNADENDDNQWGYVFKNLVKYYDGAQITYSVSEADGTCSFPIEKTAANCRIAGGWWDDEYNDCDIYRENDKISVVSPNAYTDEDSCENAGFNWNNGTSLCWSYDASDYLSKQDCESASSAYSYLNYMWYKNQCFDSDMPIPLPETQVECENDGFIWVTGRCYKNLNDYWNAYCRETMGDWAVWHENTGECGGADVI